MMKTFPIKKENLYEETTIVENKIFGNRFHKDQTLYEYLIEFLLIFCSPKSNYEGELSGKMRFHNKGEDLTYWAETMMGLRRFIFFDVSKKDKSIVYDEEASNLLVDEIIRKMDIDSYDKTKTVHAIQDLLRGYAVIVKKRTWCAQQILPICPELVFCEANPNYQHRQEKIKSSTDSEIDTSFQFKQRNFLARGGELYYLHILQALEIETNNENRDKLNSLLSYLMSGQRNGISTLCRFIQNTWYEQTQISEEKKYEQYSLEYIPSNAYSSCGSKTIEELINYLSSDFQQIKKIEILAKGIMFQVMRMMYSAVCSSLNIQMKPWVFDMTNNTSKTTKQIANKSFINIEEDFLLCIKNEAVKLEYSKEKLLEKIKEAQDESFGIFKAKGKEIGCIIPIRGSFERFTLSEDLLRFLVLSLIKPNEKITFDTFLDRLHKHFGIVIAAKQYEESYSTLESDQLNIKNNLYSNQKCFQDYLKSTGFLKELSDSTSLVFNPYLPIDEEEIK